MAIGEDLKKLYEGRHPMLGAFPDSEVDIFHETVENAIDEAIKDYEGNLGMLDQGIDVIEDMLKRKLTKEEKTHMRVQEAESFRSALDVLEQGLVEYLGEQLDALRARLEKI